MKGFTLRIEEELLEKFHYICRYNHRSANQQLLVMIEQRVRKFEESNGEITAELRQAMFRDGS